MKLFRQTMLNHVLTGVMHGCCESVGVEDPA